ncbi:Proclotting enzyme [Amphibalanus amphitrite]|uniref:limulus clotting factor C n=1 Tax=Amphibalanus amphitrite TaxID=1232801 RepID=A0A6A4X5W8_AMPAM|nr:transmembrane protease serine 6-like [Amphibalanus amphitrite]KAF0310348.1 Proclotting enzyme [Amphibalanus amphitrite]
MKTCQLLVLGCLLAGALALPSTLQDQEGGYEAGKPLAERPEFDGKMSDNTALEFDGMEPHFDGTKRPAPEDRTLAPLGDSDTPSARSGALSCGSHVIAEGSSAVIESPNYPSNYDNYAYCAYSFTTDTGKELQLNCETFELEGDESCEQDWLRVNDIKYCGSSGPSAVGGSRLDIVFFSDKSTATAGYRCTVTLAEPTVVPAGSHLSCGTSRLARGEHTITDGDGDYGDNVDCYYQLYADQAGDQLSVTCSQFDVEYDSMCLSDWLSLNGIRFCSTRRPSDVAAVDRMSIHWHTDRSSVRPGFECTVTVEETPPPSDACACGQVNRASRIVGGEETEANEYPWQAAIFARHYYNTLFCGGAIINSLYVLTTARCTSQVSASDIQVLLRKHLTGQDDNEIRFSVAQIKAHPYYDPDTHHNDFSLLRLATAITFPADNKIAPACMPTASNDFVGADAIVTGFGTTSHRGPKPATLQEANVPIMSYYKCASAYQRRTTRTVTSSMICTGLLGLGGKGWCHGDQGGPLVSLENNRYSLVGVVSWSIGCARPDYPGVYARVTDALSWIWTSAADGEYCRDPAAN